MWRYVLLVGLICLSICLGIWTQQLRTALSLAISQAEHKTCEVPPSAIQEIKNLEFALKKCYHDSAFAEGELSMLRSFRKGANGFGMRWDCTPALSVDGGDIEQPLRERDK